MIIQNFIHQAVFIGYAAAPMTRPIPPERFGFAGSVKRVAHNFGDQSVNLPENIPVFCFPLTVFGKGGGHKADHCCAACIACSSVSKVISFPSLSSLRILSMRSRFAGELKRYSVSSDFQSDCSRTSISTTRLGYVFLIVSIKALSSSLVSSLYVVTMLNTITDTDGIGKSVWCLIRNQTSPLLPLSSP